MAIKLKRTFETGLEAEYWRIGNFVADLEAGVLSINLLLYKDEAARKAGKSYIHGNGVRIPMQKDALVIILNGSDALLPQLYSMVKSLDSWVEAVDCQEGVAPAGDEEIMLEEVIETPPTSVEPEPTVEEPTVEEPAVEESPQEEPVAPEEAPAEEPPVVPPPSEEPPIAGIDEIPPDSEPSPESEP